MINALVLSRLPAWRERATRELSRGERVQLALAGGVEPAAALQPGLLAAAPQDVLSAADEARQAVEEAWRVLADPAARESYDEQIGFVRPGEGLDPHRRGPERLSHVVVPDIRGLFYGACLEVAGRVGLHVAPVQLTPHPMPVEGLAVGQTPVPGERVHRDSTLTVRVWHPAAYSA